MPAAQPDPAAALVKDSDTDSFMADVIEVSATTPVIVDLWAPWCGPCKQLGPVLEKAVNEARGKVRMVKINIDENQQLAQGLRVQSIPAVFVFFGGRPVDGFMGALPESQVKAFVEKCVKLAPQADGADAAPDVNSLLKQAEGFLAEGKPDHAAALYEEALKADANLPAAHIGLIRAVLAMGGTEEAQHLYEQVPQAAREDKGWAAIESAMKLSTGAANAVPSSELRVKVDADPKNHQARQDYALALFAEGKKEEAVDALLEIVRRDRKWNEESARKQLVSIFEALGHTDPLTVAGRKKLSSILFS